MTAVHPALALTAILTAAAIDDTRRGVPWLGVAAGMAATWRIWERQALERSIPHPTDPERTSS